MTSMSIWVSFFFLYYLINYHEHEFIAATNVDVLYIQLTCFCRYANEYTRKVPIEAQNLYWVYEVWPSSISKVSLFIKNMKLFCFLLGVPLVIIVLLSLIQWPKSNC